MYFDKAKNDLANELYGHIKNFKRSQVKFTEAGKLFLKYKINEKRNRKFYLLTVG